MSLINSPFRYYAEREEEGEVMRLLGAAWMGRYIMAQSWDRFDGGQQE